MNDSMSWVEGTLPRDVRISPSLCGEICIVEPMAIGTTREDADRVCSALRTPSFGSMGVRDTLTSKSSSPFDAR